MPAADGTLAYTAFKDRILELDYTVGVSEPLQSELPSLGFCGTLTTPTFGKQGPPISVSTGFSVNDKPITAQVDTLFGGTMLVYPPSVEKLGLAEVAQTTRRRFFKYTTAALAVDDGHWQGVSSVLLVGEVCCAARDSRFALLAAATRGALGTCREFLRGELQRQGKTWSRLTPLRFGRT